MPLSSPSSYLPTIDLFLPHWTAANTTAGAAIVVMVTKSVATLTTLRASLVAQWATVEAEKNGLETARGQLGTAKAAALVRLNEFTGLIRSTTEEPGWLEMLPLAFKLTDAPARVLRRLQDMANVWERFETTGPVSSLELQGPYTLTDFQADIAALDVLAKAFGSATNGLGKARADRNTIQGTVRAILVPYRKRIASMFPKGSATRETLPRLTPLAGSTPTAVPLTGLWDATEGVARLAWEASTDARVVGYQTRYVTGETYDTEEELVLGNYTLADPRAWEGLTGLAIPGATISCKVYTLTADAHEKGSNAVTITRPEA